MTQFNVLIEPWIEAIDLDGKTREYGLIGLLDEAHNIKEVTDTSPTIRFGIYRVLVAFVQHALEIREFEDLGDVFDEGQFDPERLVFYTEQIGEARFDLFDRENPFLQSRAMPGDTKTPKSVVELFYQFPTGTNVIHFCHMEAKDHAVSPAVAARALCSIAPFMTAGGAGYSPSINGTPPWYVLARGDNLFETILLNCCVMDISGLNQTVGPAWATDDYLEPKKEKGAQSLLEGFTWQPRQVRFIASEGGTCTYSGATSPVLIREMAWGPGYKFGGHDIWFDPNVAYYHDAKRGHIPIRPREEREVWRDYGPLFLLHQRGEKNSPSTRPTIVTQLADLKRERFVPEDKAEHFEVYGMRVDKAKVFEWRHEVFPLYTGLLENEQAAPQLYHALDLAESVAKAIYGSLKLLYPRGGGGNRNAFNRIIHAAQSHYWSALESYFGSAYLPSLASQKPDDEAGRKTLLDLWKEELRRCSRSAFGAAAESIASGAAALKRQVEASNSFNGRLRNILSEKVKGD